jgi:hypothetical protein
MFRTLSYIGIAAAVVAGPPVAYSTAPEYWKSVISSLPVVGSGETGESPAAPDPTTAEVPGVTQHNMPVEGPAVANLNEVFRFNVTPGWITSRWPRVSTGGAVIQLQGYRVPLVTGTKDTDIAGSLTYYFNAQQKVQRITFDGTTGNATNLVRMLTSKYGFVRRLTNNPGIFIFEFTHADGRTKSLLTITSAATIKASDPYRRFKVQLRLEKPATA